MIVKVYDLLENVGVPIEFNVRPDMTDDNKIVISYHLFNERGYQFGDGKITKYGGNLQVDLFAKHRVDYRNAKKLISKILTKAGFNLMYINTTSEYVEGIGYIDHTVFTFSYLDKDKIFAFDGKWIFNGEDYFGKI